MWNKHLEPSVKRFTTEYSLESTLYTMGGTVSKQVTEELVEIMAWSKLILPERLAANYLFSLNSYFEPSGSNLIRVTNSIKL